MFQVNCYLGPSGPHPYRDHHLGHPHPERPGWKGPSHSRADLCCSEEIWIPGGNCRAVRREGCHSRSLRHCSGRVPPLQAYWWFGRPQVLDTLTACVLSGCVTKSLLQGLLWCPPIHHGIRCQGLRGCRVGQAPRPACQEHEVRGRPHDPQWRAHQCLCRLRSQTRLAPPRYFTCKHPFYCWVTPFSLQVCWASRWRSCCRGTLTTRTAPSVLCPTTFPSWSPKTRPKSPKNSKPPSWWKPQLPPLLLRWSLKWHRLRFAGVSYE